MIRNLSSTKYQLKLTIYSKKKKKKMKINLAWMLEITRPRPHHDRCIGWWKSIVISYHRRYDRDRFVMGNRLKKKKKGQCCVSDVRKRRRNDVKTVRCVWDPRRSRLVRLDPRRTTDVGPTVIPLWCTASRSTRQRSGYFEITILPLVTLWFFMFYLYAPI